LVPTPEWKKSKRGQRWYPGDTCQMAVGQGDCLVTPLQMARLAAAVANDGYLVTPHVLKSEEQLPQKTTIGLRPATLTAIQAGMRAVVEEGGTAHKIASESYAIAGKTGTAQATGGKPHAWFAGYAPADHPTIALAVMVEHGGNGSETAAPIARRMFDAWLERKQ
jgi:penicillin-binding protein 2